MSAFERTFHVRWGDMDFNAHMRNTAYLDISGDVRMMYFAEHGFAMKEFERLRFGPVILKDELEYFRELHLLESIRVDLHVAGLNDDAGRFLLRNDFFREDKLVARVTSHGGWLNLDRRKLTPPPDALAELLRSIPRTADFSDL